MFKFQCLRHIYFQVCTFKMSRYNNSFKKFIFILLKHFFFFSISILTIFWLSLSNNKYSVGSLKGYSSIRIAKCPWSQIVQNFHETSLNVPEKTFITKTISPTPPPHPEYRKNVFFLKKKSLFTRIWEKIMILMGLLTRIFTKFFTPKGRRGGSHRQTKTSNYCNCGPQGGT